ncbi:MAG: hypothetical protein QOF24_695 [Verrucomicrobiota bacterium]|jgi:uncharacterized membrane protein
MRPSTLLWELKNEIVKEPDPPAGDRSGKSPIRRSRRLENSLYTLAALIALLGLSDSIYLTVHHLTGQDVDCLASGSCETVLTSAYAAVGKIPLAAFGAVAYFSAFSLATLAGFGRRWARRLLLCLVGGMLGMTCWLLYLQAFVLHAFCDFCLLSAGLTMTLSAIVLTIFFMEKRTAHRLSRQA